MIAGLPNLYFKPLGLCAQRLLFLRFKLCLQKIEWLGIVDISYVNLSDVIKANQEKVKKIDIVYCKITKSVQCE